MRALLQLRVDYPRKLSQHALRSLRFVANARTRLYSLAPHRHVPPVQRPILDRLHHVRHADLLRGVDIGDGAGEFENAVVGAGGEVELVNGGYPAGASARCW